MRLFVILFFVLVLSMGISDAQDTAKSRQQQLLDEYQALKQENAIIDAMLRRKVEIQARLSEIMREYKQVVEAAAAKKEEPVVEVEEAVE